MLEAGGDAQQPSPLLLAKHQGQLGGVVEIDFETTGRVAGRLLRLPRSAASGKIGRERPALV